LGVHEGKPEGKVKTMNKLDKLLQNYLTSREVAQLKGFTQTRIRQLILSGNLPAKKIGNVWFIHIDDADSVHKKRK